MEVVALIFDIEEKFNIQIPINAPAWLVLAVIISTMSSAAEP